MRAARLLHILLLLQNRGRMSSTALAGELEVAPRTILRDIDALTEAGLPVVTYQGNRGGFELGFNYRTRLTGLAADEAEALGIMLAMPAPHLDALGIEQAAGRAVGKLIESFPDAVREKIAVARQRFRFTVPARRQPADPRVEALARAIRSGCIVRIKARSRRPRVVHPAALEHDGTRWLLIDARAGVAPIPDVEWGDVNISAKQY